MAAYVRSVTITSGCGGRRVTNNSRLPLPYLTFGSLPPSLKSALRLPHHLPDAVAALDVHLTDEEIRTLEEPYSPHLPTAF